jgi:hypothetical protein
MSTRLDLFHRPDPNSLQSLVIQLPPVILPHTDIQPQLTPKV